MPLRLFAHESHLRNRGRRSKTRLDLHGRYHHSANFDAVQRIRYLCKQDRRFQFPSVDQPVLPIRSNSDFYLIKEGALHDIALDSILLLSSQWYQTLTAIMVDTEEKRFEIKSIGAEPFIPRSLASGLDDGSVSKWTPDSESPGTSQSSRGGTCDRSPLPEQLLIYISPRSDSDLSEIDIGINPSAVAVIGIACRFPRADSVEDYWRLISTGTSTVQRIPEDRFCMKDFWREPKGSFWGNFLNDPKAFDHRFFSISGREAKFMDPQQRLVLQVVYEAMESSGYYGPCLGDRPANVGCYVGVGSVDYEMNVASENATAFSALGTLRAFISGRVSHHFGWNGPSITYDTACSSSAVAIHSACKVCPLSAAIAQHQVYQCSLSLTRICRHFKQEHARWL